MDAFHDIRPVPISVILSWPAPNYHNPVRRGPALLIVNCVLLPLTFAIVTARLYTRLRVVRSAGLDDLFIALAMIPAVGLTICVILAVTHYSWDIHVWDVPVKHLQPSRKIAWACQFIFNFAANLTKLSILLFYRRMSATVTKKFFYYSIWVTIVFTVLYWIIMSIVLITACTPVASYWDIQIPGHHCINERTFELTAAIINIILDFVIIVLPLPTVWSLQLPRKQKIALSCIFFFGFLTCVAGIVRVYYVQILVNVTYDVTWEGFVLWIYVAIEIDVAMICASAPALKPLFKHYLDGTMSRSNDRYGGGGYPSNGKNPASDLEGSNSQNSRKHGGIHVQKEVELSSFGSSRSQPTHLTNRSAQESDESILVLQQPDQVHGTQTPEMEEDLSRRPSTYQAHVSAPRKENWSSV